MVRNGLKFVGIKKTATRKFPITHIPSIELVNRGDTLSFVTRKTQYSNEYDIINCVWMDKLEGNALHMFIHGMKGFHIIGYE